MFAARSVVFSKKDQRSSATISLCLSNQGRKSQLRSRATHNGLREMGGGVKEIKTRRETRASSITNL